MNKRMKRFLGTLAIIGVFVVGTVFGSEVILKFTGTNTIEEAETLIQKLTQERNYIVDEYNKLDSTATDKITELNTEIKSLNTQITTLTQQKEALEKQIEKSKTENTQLRAEIESLKSKITSLEAEIHNKDNELAGKDRLLEEKDSQLRDKDSKITDLENELKIANNKCKELQDVIDGVVRKEFKQSDLVQDNN